MNAATTTATTTASIHKPAAGLFDSSLVTPAIRDAFAKLNPRHQ